MSPFLLLSQQRASTPCLRQLTKMKEFRALKGPETIEEVQKSLIYNVLMILIFCDAKEEQLSILRLILALFEGFFGLHINWNERHLYPINLIPNMELVQWVTCLQYTLACLLEQNRSLEIWNPVLSKCEKIVKMEITNFNRKKINSIQLHKKLSRWKSQYLFLGGRLTLITATFDALPTYVMSPYFRNPRQLHWM